MNLAPCVLLSILDLEFWILNSGSWMLECWLLGDSIWIAAF